MFDISKMNNINSLEDMSDICRICLEKSSKMYPLVGPILNADTDVATMITFCTSVEIIPDEDLPKGVCVPCFRTIRIAYNFISEFIEMNKKLLQLKTELKMKQEITCHQEFDNIMEEGHLPNIDQETLSEEAKMGEENLLQEEEDEQIIIRYVDNILSNSEANVSATDSIIILNQKNKVDAPVDECVYYQPLRKKVTVKSYSCPICSKTFMKFETGFVPHMYTHENVQISCRKCSLETMFEIHEYLQHYKKVHLYQCHICDKSFSRRSSQYYHMKAHSGSKLYTCSYQNCKKTFMTPWNLKKHQNTHSESIKYICSKCGRKFNTYDTFRYHQKTHDGRRSHLCPECGRAFLQSVHLKYHMWKHTGIKQFHCEKCEKSYTSVTQLKKHLRKYCGAEKKMT